MKMRHAYDPAVAARDCTYQAHLLSNGRYSVLLSPNGGGFSALDGYALTRWVPDPVTDATGVRSFIRDRDTGAFGMTAGSHGHTFRGNAGVAELYGILEDLEWSLAICISPQHDVELRRLSLHNAGDRTRMLDVTTYAAIALNTPAADAAHPAFSKLFVQTAFDPEREALLAWRRPRSPQDRPLWLAHRLLADSDSAIEYETDRAAFIGRGRTLRDPAALADDRPLGGTTGGVLDPIFSLRRGCSLEPGGSTTLIAVYAAADSRDIALRTLDLFPHVAATDSTFAAPAAGSRDAVAALGLPKRWSETIRLVSDESHALVIPAPPRPPAIRRAATTRANDEDLQFFNGWGGFSGDGTEYVIRMPLENGAPKRPPLPWVNVIANEEAGCIVSESGATCTWTANSRENRISPWSNDPVTDPHGEALYVTDEESGEVWCPTPGPIPGAGDYEVRHGFGFTRFLHESSGIDHELTVFVPADAPVRIARLVLENRSGRPRRLIVTGYVQLVLGTHEADTRGRVETWHDPETGALMARNPDRGEFAGRVAFCRTWNQISVLAQPAISSPGNESWTTDRRMFLGDFGAADAPAALLAGSALDGWTGTGSDPCFAVSSMVELPPDAVATFVCLLGEAADEETVAEVLRTIDDVAAVDDALECVRAAWTDRVTAVRISTPCPALDLMVNGWLTYQNLSCRMWARSAYYQSGGAFGFRDQLQDSAALVYTDPAHTRRQILLHAAHQFVEGDVLHWWHPPLGKGIRTRFSDDLLWLPHVTAFYIERTGDRAILDEAVRYIAAPPLESGEEEEFVVPEVAGETGPLYEHCCRALDRSLTSGDHGLPLIGVGDWNDGMNRVGREGRGESVWLGFFLYDILHDFIPICVAREDHARVAAYSSYLVSLAEALEDAGWDGEWYRRAYYDNGEPLGSSVSDECRIDALVQAWSVISGAAPTDRAQSAMDLLEQHLVDEDAGLIRLLTPAFDRTPHDPGYIRGYLPGIRENGGQYTHGVLWAVRAFAELGRNDRAAKLLEMLSPVTRGGTCERAMRYRVEPYVIAADVYGVEPHVGRGGWTWYTGSAGWMYRVAVESILGLDLRARELRLRPCVPDEWRRFAITIRLADGTVCDVEVRRGRETGIALDGAHGRVAGAALVVTLPADGARHRIEATLGADHAVTYAPRVPHVTAARSG